MNLQSGKDATYHEGPATLSYECKVRVLFELKSLLHSWLQNFASVVRCDPKADANEELYLYNADLTNEHDQLFGDLEPDFVASNHHGQVEPDNFQVDVVEAEHVCHH